MSPLDIYLFTRLDAIIPLLQGLTLFGCIAIVVLGIICGVEYDFDREKSKLLYGFLKKIVFVMVIAVSLLIVTPTQKDMAAIYLVPKITNSEFASEVQDIPKDAAKLLNKQLQLWLKDLEPQTEGGK